MAVKCQDRGRMPVYSLALAADFDGTIAQNGSVSPETVQALYELKKTGRKLLLVTGRGLVDVKHTCPELSVFDRVVVENGAVIYNPTTSEAHIMAPAPPAAFIRKLMERNVEPLSVGHSTVATWRPSAEKLGDRGKYPREVE
jgi:HAD superfamily hydrolase (TIGR01484 family)